MRLPAEAISRWGFKRDPFADEPREVDELYMSREHQRVHHYIMQAIRNTDAVAISAPVGYGKTLLWLKVRAELEDDERAGYMVTEVSALSKESISANMILRAIHRDLEGEPVSGMDADALTRTVANVLRERSRAQRKHIVLCIDEAHRLKLPALRALKNLLDIKAGIRRILSIILLGQEEMTTTFRSHGLREVAARFQLIEPGPLSAMDGEIADYIRWRLYIARNDRAPIGGNHRDENGPFEESAFEALNDELSGDARADILTVNTAASYAMLEAHNNAEDAVNADHVRRARHKLIQGVF